MQKDAGSPGIVFIEAGELHLPEGDFAILNFAETCGLKRDDLIRQFAGVPSGDMGTVTL